MSLFDMCCPKKPKKSLDYIIKWIENADKTFSNINESIAEINTEISVLQSDIKNLEDWKSVVESNISELVTEAIENYDWSTLPAEALQAKADKVEDAVAGHLAALDANGNLVDSGSSIGESIEEDNSDVATCNAVYVALQGKTDKVSNATVDNLVSLDAGGNLQDSGKKPADFAEANHVHHYIEDFSGTDGCGANISVGEGEQGVGGISLIVKGDGHSTDFKIAEIDYSSIDNLNRALTTPSSIPEDDATKLITSKAVYDALLGKMGTLKEIFIDCDDSGDYDDWEIWSSAAGEAAFRDALVWGDDAPRLVIVNIKKGEFGTTNLKIYRTIGSIHATAVEVNVDLYDLTAEIYVDGHVLTRTGQEAYQEQTWDQGLTLEANDIFTHVSNSQ